MKLSFVMNIKLQALLDRCSKEERAAIERWFENFQAIELSKMNGISIARGASTSCPLYQWVLSRESLINEPYILDCLW